MWKTLFNLNFGLASKLTASGSEDLHQSVVNTVELSRGEVRSRYRRTYLAGFT